MRSIIEVDKNKMKFHEFSSIPVVRITRTMSYEKNQLTLFSSKM